MCWNNNASRCIEWRDGNWHNLAYVIERSSTSLKIYNYYDGQLVNINGAGTFPLSTSLTGKELIIGNGYNTQGQVQSTFGLIGTMDDFSIWNRALTADEIKQVCGSLCG